MSRLRQQVRAEARANALREVTERFGREPRRARRRIARALIRSWWKRGGTPGGSFLAPLAPRITAAIIVSAVFGIFAPWAAVPARAQGSRKDDVVFNAQGRPMAGANVRVCTASATGQPCAPLANIYSNAALTQALANPTATDGLGNYSFYAAPGRYMIEISGPAITTKQLPNVILPNDPSAPTFTSLTTTSGISAFSLSLSGNLTVTGSTAVTGALTVGGAPVPSTAQANTWSAAQTFSQDVISGSRTPWMDVRANGAACNGSTNDATPINGVINGLPAANGGTAFLPDNCVFTPPSFFTSPTQYWQTIMLGGQVTVGGTFTLPSYTELTCGSPVLHGSRPAGAFVPFGPRSLCSMAPNPTSTSPTIAALGANKLTHIATAGSTGIGIRLSGSIVTMDDVFAQSTTDAGNPLVVKGGFGYYFNGGGFSSNSTGTGQPSILFDNPASGLGACDVPRISLLDHTFVSKKGIHFSNECASPNTANNFIFRQNLYEDVDDAFLTIGDGTVPAAYHAFTLDHIEMSDLLLGLLLGVATRLRRGAVATRGLNGP